MKPSITYKIIDSVLAGSEYASDTDSMEVMSMMKTVFLVNSSGFSLKPNPKASATKYKTITFSKDYELKSLELKDLFAVDNLNEVSVFLKEKTVLVIPVPETIDVDTLMKTLRINKKLTYIVNLTEREISSTLNSVQKRMRKEFNRDLYIIDKKNFFFNENNAMNTIEKSMAFDYNTMDFKRPASFVRMVIKDIQEKLINGLENEVDGDSFFSYISDSAVTINSSMSNVIDNEYYNKSIITPKLMTKGFLGESFYDRIDLKGKLFTLMLGIVFEDSDKQTSKNGKFVPFFDYTNMDDSMIDDLSYALTGGDYRYSVYCNSDDSDAGLVGVKIDYTRSCNKSTKELEGVVAIETSMALSKLFERFFEEKAKELRGFRRENVSAVKMATTLFVAKFEKYNAVNYSKVESFEENANDPGKLEIRNKFIVKTENKDVTVEITRQY